MQRKLAFLFTTGVILFAGHPGRAQSSRPVQPASNASGGDAVRSFLPVYIHYAEALQRHGLEGFRSMTTDGFTVRHGRDHWKGAAALSQARWWLDGIQGGKVAVTVRRLTITANQAVALTQEDLAYPLLSSVSGTGTVYLKQTWQRAGDMWKLAAQEWVSEKATGPSPSLEYTVTADGGPPRTTFKEFISGPDVP